MKIRRHKKLTFVLAIATVLVGAAGAARADTVDLRFVSVGPARVVGISGPVNGNYYAGVLNHQAANGVGPIGSQLSGIIGTFCTELTQETNSSYSSFTVANLEGAPVPGQTMSAAQANLIRQLYYRADTVYSRAQYTNADYSAGFQALIWEIVYDYDSNVGLSSIGFGTGGVRITGLSATSLNFVTDMMTNALGVGNMANNVYAVVNGSNQDQIIELVPLPPATVLGALGLLAAGVVGRRSLRF